MQIEIKESVVEPLEEAQAPLRELRNRVFVCLAVLLISTLVGLRYAPSVVELPVLSVLLSRLGILKVEWMRRITWGRLPSLWTGVPCCSAAINANCFWMPWPGIWVDSFEELFTFYRNGTKKA